MYAEPTLGTYFAGVNFRDLGWNPECKDNKNLILLAWLLPSVLEITGAVLYFLVFPSDFDMSGTFLRKHNSEAYTELIKSGGSYGGYILKEFLFSLISPQLFYGIFLGMGEEIGWRGFSFRNLICISARQRQL